MKSTRKRKENSKLCFVHISPKSFYCSTCNDYVALCIHCFSEKHTDHVLGKLNTLITKTIPEARKLAVPVVIDMQTTQQEEQKKSTSTSLFKEGHSTSGSHQTNAVSVSSAFSVSESSLTSTDSASALPTNDTEWTSMYTQLKRFLHAHGHIRALYDEQTSGGNSYISKQFNLLKNWVEQQQRDKMLGVMDVKKTDLLECMVGKGSFQWSAIVVMSSSEMEKGAESVTGAPPVMNTITATENGIHHMASPVVVPPSNKAHPNTAVSRIKPIRSTVVESKSRPKKVTKQNKYMSKKSNTGKMSGEVVWWRNFYLVLTYGDTHGTFNVPADYMAVTDDNETIALGEWLNKQHNKLYGMCDRRYGALCQLAETGKLWGGTDDDEKARPGLSIDCDTRIQSGQPQVFVSSSQNTRSSRLTRSELTALEREAIDALDVMRPQFKTSTLRSSVNDKQQQQPQQQQKLEHSVVSGHSHVITGVSESERFIAFICISREDYRPQDRYIGIGSVFWKDLQQLQHQEDVDVITLRCIMQPEDPLNELESKYAKDFGFVSVVPRELILLDKNVLFEEVLTKQVGGYKVHYELTETSKRLIGSLPLHQELVALRNIAK